MTLKSALQDVKETTLAAITGLLGKLSYLASLRRAGGRYEHWGLEAVHGTESSERALKTAHTEVVSSVLRTPLASLADDLQEAFAELLPGERKDAPTVSHLNSVLVTLSALVRNRGCAIRSASSPLPPPGPEPRHPADASESSREP